MKSCIALIILKSVQKQLNKLLFFCVLHKVYNLSLFEHKKSNIKTYWVVEPCSVVPIYFEALSISLSPLMQFPFVVVNYIEMAVKLPRSLAVAHCKWR